MILINNLFYTLLISSFILLTCNPITINSNNILPVYKMDSEIAVKLDSLHYHNDSEQKEIMTSVVRQLGKGIKTGTLKERILKHLIIGPEHDSVLDSFNYYDKSISEQREPLPNIVEPLGDGVETRTMKDKMLEYIDIIESDIKGIRFYLISGDRFKIEGGNRKIYNAYIENGVIVTIKFKSDSLNYILKCSNGMIERSKHIIDFIKLIGELKNITKEVPIYFPFDERDVNNIITPNKEKFNKCYKLLQEDPSSKIDIIGHTDSEGSKEYNKKLSEDRAKSVLNYLLDNINYDQISTCEGRGEKDLIKDDRKDGKIIKEAAKLNRRVELIISCWEII